MKSIGIQNKLFESDFDKLINKQLGKGGENE